MHYFTVAVPWPVYVLQSMRSSSN